MSLSSNKKNVFSSKLSYFSDKKSKQFIASGFLIIIYTVGLVGLSSSWQVNFLSLTATNLYLSLAILLTFHQQWNKHFAFFISLCFMLGLSIEILGVATGLVFGNYHYGASLGTQIFNVPIVIGANWLMLIYCCGGVLQNSKIHIFKHRNKAPYTKSITNFEIALYNRL